jgi:hypothetical protein
MEIPWRKIPPSGKRVFCSVIPMSDSHHHFRGDVSLKRSQSRFLDGHFEFLDGLRHAYSSNGEYKTTETLHRLISSPWLTN